MTSLTKKTWDHQENGHKTDENADKWDQKFKEHNNKSCSFLRIDDRRNLFTGDLRCNAAVVAIQNTTYVEIVEVRVPWCLVVFAKESILVCVVPWSVLF